MNHCIAKFPQAEVETSSLMYANSNWYVLFRLHNILCERLAYFYHHSQEAIAADQLEKEKSKSESMETANALCLKTPSEYRLILVLLRVLSTKCGFIISYFIFFKFQ